MEWTVFFELYQNNSSQFETQNGQLYFIPKEGNEVLIDIRHHMILAYVFVGRMGGGSWEQISSSELEQIIKEG